MKYMGGKKRLANVIAGYINNIGLLEHIENYYEPFVGGGAVIERVNIQNRFGSDLNKYLIALYKKLQEPEMFEYPALTREKWDDIRHNKDKYEDWLVAWAWLGCSFNCVWFHGWGGDYVDKHGKHIDSQLGFYRGLCSERGLIKDIHFNNYRYREIGKPYHSIIYCDAPYIGTEQYRGAGEAFNFEDYYNWLIEMAQDNLVIISEYRMPADRFLCIDRFNVAGCLGREFSSNKIGHEIDRSSATECLFVVQGGWLVDKYFNNDMDIDTYDF